MFQILNLMPGRKRRSSAGWVSFNAICCHHRGHRPDRKGRGGILVDGVNWRYHCFNCNYSCGFELGKSITTKTRNLLAWCGIDQLQIDKWSFESYSKRSMYDFDTAPKNTLIHFDAKQLPRGSEAIDPNNPLHRPFYDYIVRRGAIDSPVQMMVTVDDDIERNRNRIIVPFTYRGKIVGNTSRFCDDRTPKYLNDAPTGYVFGIDQQQPDWQVCILVEGIFDALAINGCAYMHNTISQKQAALLGNLNRRIIVVPDQDPSGLAVCERALELGYQVSLPTWDDDIKDVNDAVVRYGRLPTLLGIIQNATSSQIKIKMKVNQIEKRIQ
jgi:hypothetical protein